MEICEESLRNTLKRHWGYSVFRPQQLESCQHILRGNDVVALMATGSGKSLIYQLPSVALREIGIRATTLVISPLIALIEDQVTSMKALGISVGGIGGNFDYGSELCAQNGDYAILYSTPEKILCWQHGLDQLMKNTKLVCLAIDESHCVSEWGHDFRPHYRRLGEIRDWFQLQRIPIVALTATATPLILNDIITNLKLIQPYIARTTLNRKNIKYMIRTRTGFSDLMFLFIELRQHQLSTSSQHFPPTLVYVNTKREAEDLTMKTRESQHQHLQGLAISFYHAGMTLQIGRAHV
jgi:ATP-dependent DNA helicase RecQ